jgi:phytoene dehydrogenase-like protein
VDTSADVVIIGGGHNGLVAASYLAAAGRDVVVLEAQDRLGGAVAGAQIFAGIPVSVSRFSYLVSLLPDVIVDDLGLDIELASRSVASYTPHDHGGLLIADPVGPATAASFAALTGDTNEYDGWLSFQQRIGHAAAAIAPTLTAPLPAASTIRSRLGDGLMDDLATHPIGDLVTRTFANDSVRGTVATDALIGTEAGLGDSRLVQNRCFLYHIIGNGTGQWRVPVGGMGRVAGSLARAARKSGAELITGVPVSSLSKTDGCWLVDSVDGRRWRAPVVLANCAAATLAKLLGKSTTAPEGNQLKINMVLHRLPQLKSGISPDVAFAGTLHLHQSYSELATAHAAATAGRLPDPLPCEVYCHSLTDPTILDPQLAAAGWHTLTLFGMHTPARLFDAEPDVARDAARTAALRSLQDVLAEPLEDCLATDANGQACIEVMTPRDVEAAVGMPGGHIFHGDLAWPWLAENEQPQTAAQRWGVATEYPGLLLCGSSSRRGGAVSGLGGHSAAMALLESG